MFGWSEEEMLGQHHARMFAPDDEEARRDQVELALALLADATTGGRWHQRKSGERFWATGEMKPIVDGAGVTTGYVQVLHDRTEQHRAARALRESNARLRRAQEAGGVGTFTVDLATNIVTGTREFFRLFGLDDSDKRALRDFGKEIPIVFAANMSVGVNVLLSLVEDAALRHCVGTASRAYAEQLHDIDAIAGELVALYERIGA